MSQKTYYEILNISMDATAAEIRKAYRTRAAECHPDKVMHLEAALQEEARTRMVLINEAYAVLNKPAKRQEYDEFIKIVQQRAAEAAGEAPPAAAEVPPEKPSAPAPEAASPDSTTQGVASPASGAAATEAPSEGASGASDAAPGSGAASPDGDAPAEPEEPPKPVREPKPPPVPTQEELVAHLEGAMTAIREAIEEDNPDAGWRVVDVAGFDQVLEGSASAERYRIYVTSTENLTPEKVFELAGKVQEEAATSRAALQRRYLVLLVLCLDYSDAIAVRAAVRDQNQVQLASIHKKRGDAFMVGTLHVPSGELHIPYFRTIRPEFRKLRSVAGMY